MEDDLLHLDLPSLSKSSKTLGPTPSDLLHSRECLDIWMVVSPDLPCLSKSSKTLGPTPSDLLHSRVSGYMDGGLCLVFLRVARHLALPLVTYCLVRESGYNFMDGR